MAAGRCFREKGADRETEESARQCQRVEAAGDRLTQFETDFEEITDFMMNSGKFSRENVYSASLDQNGNKIIIGERFFYQDTYFAHEKFLYWQNEFRNDPNVITYRSMVKEQ